MSPGDAFYCPETEGETPHIYVILTEADADGMVVCANITSDDSADKDALLVEKHEYTELKYSSVVSYRRTRRFPLQAIEDGINKSKHKTIIQRQSCSGALLRKLRKGLLKSRRVEETIQTHCRKEWPDIATEVDRETSANP